MNEIEFYFQGNPVGTFIDPAPPFEKCNCKYMPYRGPGHFAMQTELKNNGIARCYYDSKEGRHIFEVTSCSANGELELGAFVLSKLPEEETIEWLEPWVSATLGAEKELEKEVSMHHVLFQHNCIPRARRIDKDEILFEVPALKQYAVVKLTWSGKLELDYQFPKTELYRGIKDWIEKKMKKDHEEYTSGSHL
jgi:hypothetical protein